MNLFRRLLGGGDASIERARRPEALAAAQAHPPREGIDWLGRAPGARAPWSYRVLLWLAGLFLFRISAIRVRVRGQGHLPAGGYIAVCALHRSWVDPLLLVQALPVEPRVWFMGSGPTAFDRRWKEALLRRVGGLLPVWRGGADVSVHSRSAAAVVEEGAILGLFAEGAIGGPVAEPVRMRLGAALLCLRADATVVPVAICGAEELYRGKRISVRFLEPMTPAGLLGEAWQGRPQPGTREELRQARAMTTALSERIGAALAEDYLDTVDPPGARRRWRWLTHLMR